MSRRVLPRPAENVRAMPERHAERARFWRLALGALGLFWIVVLLWLMS